MYSEALAQRVRVELERRTPFSERRMFGGLTFLVGGNMACGVVGDELVVRVGPAHHDEALARPRTRPMDFTGRPMGGMVYVALEGEGESELAGWVEMGVRFASSLPAKG